jgi:dihydroorotate dehydrogenase electron transfer subunit
MKPSYEPTEPYPSTLHRPYFITGFRQENYRTRTFTFDQDMPCQPGQFLMAWLPQVDEKPFSIAGAHPLRLTIVAVGPFSEAIHRLQVGDKLWVRGPLGHGFQLEGKHALLAGGGYGVAPLLFLAHSARERGMKVEVCIGARKAEDVLLVEQFEAAGVKVHIATEDGSLGQPGLVTLATGQALQRGGVDCVYACGPTRMLEAIDQQCAQFGVARQLSWEAHMRCGMGLCGSCEQPLPGAAPGDHRGTGFVVCQDGPVEIKRP